MVKEGQFKVSYFVSLRFVFEMSRWRFFQRSGVLNKEMFTGHEVVREIF